MEKDVNSLRRNEARTWDITVIDIVGYSDLTEDAQIQAIDRLTKVVKEAKTLKKTKRSDRFFIPTGDGMIIGFLGLPERPLELAKEIHRAYGSDRGSLKIGIHSGFAFQIRDINDQPNFAGSGINMAQRVESCCSPGHVLVANNPGEALRNIGTWRSQLQGPYEFRVKHKKPLLAFNFIDNALAVGNPAEPTVNRLFKPDYTTVKERLARKGVVGSNELREPEIIKKLQDPLIIENTILESDILGFRGVGPEQVEVTMTKEPPLLPDFVHRAKLNVTEPAPNRRKVYLANWCPPISDQGDILGLTLGTKWDFWTSLAVEEVITQIHKEVQLGKLDLYSIPRPLNCHIVVITADKKLILGRRSGVAVRYEKLKWGASIGESIDGEKDLNTLGKVDPSKTVRRALSEPEELGLPDSDIQSADLKFVALVTEWHYMIAVLIAVVRLPNVDYRELRDRWALGAHDGGEIVSLDAVDFTIDQCLPLFVTGQHMPADRSLDKDGIYSTSRVAILAALMYEFGYQNVQSNL